MSYLVPNCALSVQIILVPVIQHYPVVRPLTSPTSASGFQASTHSSSTLPTGASTAPGGASTTGGGGGVGGGGPGEADSRSSSARSSMDEVPQALPHNREPSWGSGVARPRSLLDYNVYMAKYIHPQGKTENSAATGHSPESSPLTTKRVSEYIGWMNECINLWVDGWMDGWMAASRHGWMDA